MQVASSRPADSLDTGSRPVERERRPKWMQYGGLYRSIDDTTKPWVPSPFSRSPLPIPNAPVFTVDLSRPPGDVSSIESGASTSSTTSRNRTYVMVPLTATHEPRKRSRTSTIRRFARKLGLGSTDVRSDPSSSKARVLISPSPPPISSRTVKATRVQPHEWKEWGYYARPMIRGVVVHNTASPPEGHAPLESIHTTKLTPEEVIRSVSSPRGSSHPERWKLDITHPSLPPRPSRWDPPDPHKPLPFPWEVQLNPFLEHILFGVPRMYWDVREDNSAAQYGLNVDEDENGFSRPLSPADLAQPASWPFLTHMYINGLADDISPRFLWPFMVLNPDGIKVRDVVNSIHSNFREYVRSEEYYGWTFSRRKEAAKAHKRRCDPVEHAWKAACGELDPDDDMRRIDYLGGRTLFRGLAPNPDASGWVLYLGQD